MKNYNLKIIISESGNEMEKNIQLEANNTKELSQKLNALKVLNKSINHDDLMSTVEMISEKPDLIPVVKNMLEDGENLSEGQMMMPSLSAIRYSETYKNVYERINEHKEHKMIGIVAIQRKLLGLIYTLWKNDTVYIENYEKTKLCIEE